MSDTAYQDLLKDTSESKENGNYFLLTITDLNPNVSYPIQFRWKYKDNRSNDAWSPFKIITTPGESEPNTPKFENSNVNVSEPEKIIITWDGTSDDTNALQNYDRVDVYIDGLPFDGEKVAYSFKAAGTAIIPAPAGTYQIALYAVSKTGKLSPVSAAVTKTVTAAGTAITSPEDPDTPTIEAGLASILVSWNGKKTGGADLTTTGFAGAKVYIGTTSNFTPSDNNWVHTLNFANGSNQVAIGVGTVIDKTLGTKLAYGTEYYIKLGTVNASGAVTGNYVASSPSKIAVSKLPASEISTGILSADASITAGASSGARVVMSGASSPFVIYGTDGTTKLLEFIGGSTGSLAITGGGKFTGDLEIGSSNAIFKAQPSVGIWLGNALYASAPFSVSNNGVIKAEAGTIGGWTLGSTYLQGNNLKLDTSGITVGSTALSYFDISPSALTHRNSNGTASGKFTLTLGSSPQLTLDGTLTVGGNSVATSSDLAGKISTGGAASDINSNTTTVSGGKIRTGVIQSTGYTDTNPVSNFSSSGMQINLDNGVIKAPQFGIASDGKGYFKGTVTVSSGTKTTSINNDATITLVDSSTGFLTGGGISITSGTESLSVSASAIFFNTSAGIFTNAGVGGYGSGDLIITPPNGSDLYLGANSQTGFVRSNRPINASLNNISAGSSSTTPSDASDSALLNSNGSIVARRGQGIPAWFGRYGSSGTVEAVRFLYSSGFSTMSDAGGINISTGTPSFRAPSDYRLKDNIEDYSGGLEKIEAARVRTFIMKSDSERNKQIGFVAHEFAQAFPEFVQGQKDAVDEDGNPEYQSIMTTNLIPYLVSAIQDLNKQNKSLKERLDALEG